MTNHGDKPDRCRVAWRDVAWLAVLWLATGPLWARVMSAPLALYDEALVLNCASRILQGEVPYRSFYAMYPPGQMYVLAFFFSLFGESVAIARMWGLVVHGVWALCVYALICRGAGRGVARVAYAATLFWQVFIPGHMHASPVFPFLACAALAVLALARSYDVGQEGASGVAGVWAGVSMLFRHDMGLALGTALAGAMVLIAWHAWRTGSRELRPAGRQWLVFCVCAAVPPVLGYGALGLAGAGPGMMEQLVGYARAFPSFRRLPYPNPVGGFPPEAFTALASAIRHLHLRGISVVLPALLLVSALASLRLLLRKQPLLPGHVLFLLVSALAAVFFPQTLVRSDIGHFQPLALASIPLAFLLFVSGFRRWPRFSYGLIAGSFLGLLASQAALLFLSPAPCPDLQRTVAHINARHAGQSLYVGVENHDRFVIHAAAIYFLTETRFGSRYHWLEPQAVTTERIQREIVAELEESRVDVVVLSPGWWPEPNLTAVDHGIGLLDRYIERHYGTGAQFGEYRILSRLPCTR